MAWDASEDTNVTGYAVYSGATSGHYTARIDAGTNTMAVVSNLNCWATYYFVVTAYNAAGTESLPSHEVFFTVPATVKMTMPTTPGAPPILTFPVAAGHAYEIQATSDLKTWSSIWQSDVQGADDTIAFQDPADTGTYQMRFYRVVLH